MSANGQPLVMRLLAEQRKRCLATVLTAAETSSWWSHVSASDQDAYRGQVRTAIAVFYDFARDVVKVTEDDGSGSTRNDYALELIRAIHTQQTRLSEQLLIIGPVSSPVSSE